MVSAVDRAVETIHALAATTELDYVDISWGALNPLPMYTQAEYSIPFRSVDRGTSTQPSQLSESHSLYDTCQSDARRFGHALTSPSSLSPCSTSARAH